MKSIQIEKKEIKASLFGDDTILYMRDPKDSTKKLLELINTSAKMAGYKINIPKSVAYLYTKDRMRRRRGNISLHINTIPLSKPNQRR